MIISPAQFKLISRSVLTVFVYTTLSLLVNHHLDESSYFCNVSPAPS